MRRLAFAVPGDLAAPTGGYAYDRRMIAELRKLGWEIDVVDLGDGFPWPDDAARMKAWLALNEIPDGRIIVIDGLAFGVLPEAVLQLRALNPLVVLVHHPLALESGLTPQQKNILATSERAALMAARRVIANSAETARILARDYGVPEGDIVIACPGTDKAAPARGSGGSVVHLLSVGAIVPRKGFDILMAALATLTDLPWRLTIAGDRGRDPACAAQLDADIARFGLAGRIDVRGAIDASSLTALYDGADAFVLASHFEGFGMAYAEAIARGLPVIGSTGGAITETVAAEASLLVPPGDVDAFAAALRIVIANRSKRETMAAAARSAAGALPTWEQSAAIVSRALEAIA